MKQKIRIMKPKPELSDQEIRSYMDFDGLLVKQKQHTPIPVGNGLKWGVLVVLLGSISLWWFTQEKGVVHPESPMINEKNIEDKPQADQSVVDSTETHQQSKEKVVDGKAPNIEQSPAGQQVQKKGTPETPVPSPQESVYFQAEPVEGYAHLYQYFSAELVYPSLAIKDSVQGVLTVAFTVNTEGKPENIHVTQSLGEVFDQEAIRLIQNMPAWKPATLNNRPVPSKIALPLTFQIQKVKVQE
jgi:TonB family protein